VPVLFITREINRRIFLGRKIGADIDNAIPSGIGQIAVVSLREVLPCDGEAALLIPFPVEVDEGVVADILSEFEGLDPRTRYRGKFALKFFNSWTTLLTREFQKNEVGLFKLAAGDGGKVRSGELGIGALAAKSPMPEGLQAFLRDNAIGPVRH
jgi:hypothetical protein